ncbi:nucleoside phosphorylase [Lachnoclostridium phytofermentans]|uniref:Uridine phosphorylase n=1 Tax=Lachnoclostridium phytofermentans (strain ATCC 700394 / DSM 18823 / ISDg) TaxID=357809 RepID=A9KS37_LACP7|nr:nucleoside phosphorylase [Lachnoclostridium phytofermentans]ABX40668.1 purine or other phosphorylase family 1 [Lachnoclostridium phytofermentans ISDg]
MILEEFDSNKKAIINPEEIIEKIPDFPRVGVSCFSLTLFNRIISILNPSKIAQTGTASTQVIIYEITYHDVKIAFYMSPVGAPACAAVYEDLIAMGLDKLVLFGTCGVLDRTIADCSIIIPTSAVRDEGTSYHYMPASDEIKVNNKGIDIFKEILSKHHYSYTEGKIWTTDGIYRETREKLEKRKSMGCICVDMECSAMAAVAAFRECELFHFFYAADNLDSDNWDARSLGNLVKLDEKEKIALLALEMASKF